jgi:Lon protease-like protein
MTRAALAEEGHIGMVTVRPEHVGDMSGDPPVFPVGALGTIQECEELADGRFNVVLHGATRFRVSREIPRTKERLYRLAEVELLPEAPADAERVRALRARILEAFGRLVQRVAPDRADALGPHRFADVGDAELVGALVHVLSLPPLERQGILETDGVEGRLAALEGIVHFQLASVGLDDLAGGGRVH